MKLFVSLSGFLLVLLAQPTLACTPVEGYRTPTNFEMVRKSSLIVLARVVSGPDEMKDLKSEVLIEPVKVLKGTLPAGPLHVAGGLAWNGKAIPSLPTTLAQSHFSAGLGACIRIFYPKGGLIVAMFGPTPKEMKAESGEPVTQLFEPFARAVEDVEAEDGLWVGAIQDYVKAQQDVSDVLLPSAADQLRERLAGQPATVASRAMVDDLDYYLRIMRNGGKKVDGDNKPFWTMLAAPQDSFVSLVDPARQESSVLRCAAGGDGLELLLVNRPGLSNLALRIGGTQFAAKPYAFDWKTLPKGSAGKIAFTDDLRSMMMTGTEPASVLSAGESGTAAPPLDALQKLAVQRAHLLSKTAS